MKNTNGFINSRDSAEKAVALYDDFITYCIESEKKQADAETFFTEYVHEADECGDIEVESWMLNISEDDFQEAFDEIKSFVESQAV
ncbi:MAG: hypothetical protein Pg6A_19450 [Termitinemataceae bacterium]|nr:MAG: hypothetical protein Pg6A_19450 [Termitinemataceae bacterium]